MPSVRGDDLGEWSVITSTRGKRSVTAVAVVVSLTLGIALTTAPGAGADVTAGGREPGLRPPKESTAKRTKVYRRTLRRSLADIQAFWSETMPLVYGLDYGPIPAKRQVAARPGVTIPTCQGQRATYEQVQGNAFYCAGDAFIAWDDADFFPGLLREFGSLSIGLVLAHEWGHAVQDQTGNIGQLTLYKELQADCFAGSWMQRVSNGDSRLSLEPGSLDSALTALLVLRDAPGSSPDNPGAHGSAFDRVSAFQQGFESGAEACATYFDSPPATTEVLFRDEEVLSGGNLAADEVVPATVDLLNEFYGLVVSGYQAITIDNVLGFDTTSRDLPACGGSTLARKEVRNRVFYCIDDGYIAFDVPYLQHVYDDIGDFGVAALVAEAWATHVEIGQGVEGAEDNTNEAILLADCYVGGWSASLWLGALPSLQGVRLLSAGDLDEFIQALIDYHAARGVTVDDTVFPRVQAFRQGFFQGFNSCR